MEAVRCSKGHYYDKHTHAECPVCAGIAADENKRKKQERVFGGVVKCSAGHYYDHTLPDCPVCAVSRKSPVEVTLEKDSTISEITETGIVRCPLGHAYDKSLGFCPICAASDNSPEDFPETVASDPETVAGGIVKCSAGHYYLRGQKKCPICASGTDEVEVTEPVKDMVTCVNGHIYDKLRHRLCPICGGQEKKSRQETRIESENQPETDFRVSFADTEPSNDLLLFTAFQGLSYRIFREKGEMWMTVRMLVTPSGLILENSVGISMSDAMDAARKILNTLTKDGHPAFLDEPSSRNGNSRLLFNTRQLNCDHRWDEKVSLYGSPAEGYMRTVHEILGELYARTTQEQRASKANSENLCARLDFLNLDLRLSREENTYALSLEALIYYQFTNSITLRETVSVPADAGAQILSWLGECGVMEALISKNKRPGDGICRDPAMATVFYLKTGSLTYDYRDWDKLNQGQESTALNRAQDRLLAWFNEHRNKAIS